MKIMNSWDELEKNMIGHQIVIFGCGVRGLKLCRILHLKKTMNIMFFDNDIQKQGRKICGHDVIQPQILPSKTIYIIAVDNEEMAMQMERQLQELHIEKVYYFNDKIYREYKKTLSNDEIEKELEEICQEQFGYTFNIQEPKTYNEIINWEKTHIFDARRTKLADKVLVRDWVASKIGEKYLNTEYYVFENEEEIDFDSLPKRYVLKLNNGSGRNIIVKDSNQINRKEILKKLHDWREDNFAYQSFEMQYKDIKPKIICEEFLEGIAENLYDYNVYCFHGEPEYIWCIKGSHRPGCQATFYDKNWNRQEFSYGYPIDPSLAPKPQRLEEMLELSRILAKEFEHVRVDWYILPIEGLRFGEMSFSTWGGLEKFVPNKYDRVFGDLITGKM